ncbi:dihydrodipicolinate synthase family protein [Marivita sp. GX14005]|uniref:dihydrodipicolinate synthase family protein n=1 Tax=Marivita sp. GX14005 TaxID=2942276 RepID=UPI002019D7D7|nr:dihydrodipicolinate synthase family protein [Marivita sp. GX14005]MCL3883176.1 dihydrodipicolinate synthase family protein [Marivita sp. GX14005]
MTKTLTGMYAALMTGLADNGGFDETRQRGLTDYVLKQDLAGLYVGGSSGEAGLLNVEELLAQQAIVADCAKGRGTTLIAHVGAPNLRDSIRLAERARDLGYHALSALPPHSYPFSDAEIETYYRDLAAATELPLIVYEVPIRTGRPIPLPSLERILNFPNVSGIKFTSTDMFKFSMLRRRCPEATYFFGFDEIYTTGAVLGADGGIGTTYNILGKLYVALHAAMRQGDLPRAQELQEASQIFVEALLDTGVLPGMKAALRLRGIECGPTRAPMALRMSENDAEAQMRAVLERPEIAPWLI